VLAPAYLRGAIRGRITMRYGSLTQRDQSWFRNETQVTTHE
jgi:hypothetical protein